MHLLTQKSNAPRGNTLCSIEIFIYGLQKDMKERLRHGIRRGIRFLLGPSPREHAHCEGEGTVVGINLYHFPITPPSKISHLEDK